MRYDVRTYSAAGVPLGGLEPMRLGLSSFVFRYAVGAPVGEPMDAFTLLRRAYAYGLDAVQFSDNLPLHLMGESEHAALRNLAGDLGVGIEVGTRGMDHQLLRSYVALAAFYGSHALRLVLDEPDSGRAESELRWLLPLLEEHRLPLAIENHGEMPAAELEALVQRIGHPLLGFCVDTANNLVLLERPMETMAPLAGRATQLHLKDYVVQRSPVGYRITGCPLGEGALDLRATIRLIRPLEREMDVFLECWMDPAPSRVETLLQEERWIARSVACAQALFGGAAENDSVVDTGGHPARS